MTTAAPAREPLHSAPPAASVSTEEHCSASPKGQKGVSIGDGPFFGGPGGEAEGGGGCVGRLY